MPKPFIQRVAESVDHPIDAAFAVRPRGTILTTALCAGLGAATGSIVGGAPLWAGVGGGAGALLGYLIVWLRLLGSDQSLGMAIAPASTSAHAGSSTGSTSPRPARR